MTIRLNFIRETPAARLYEDKDGAQYWIPRSVVNSTTKFPQEDLGKPVVHELILQEWFYEKLFGSSHGDMEEDEDNEE